MTAVMIAKPKFDDPLANGEIPVVMPFYSVLEGLSPQDPTCFLLPV